VKATAADVRNPHDRAIAAAHDASRTEQPFRRPGPDDEFAKRLKRLGRRLEIGIAPNLSQVANPRLCRRRRPDDRRLLLLEDRPELLLAPAKIGTRNETHRAQRAGRPHDASRFDRASPGRSSLLVHSRSLMVIRAPSRGLNQTQKFLLT